MRTIELMRRCICISRHKKHAERFVREYRDAVGAAFEFASLNLASRKELHRYCGRRVNKHMNRGQRQYLAHHKDTSSPDDLIRVTVVAKLGSERARTEEAAGQVAT